MFQASADTSRLEILHQLKDGERCVSERTDLLRTGQSRLSFHLKVLKEAGLIFNPKFRSLHYCVINTSINFMK